MATFTRARWSGRLRAAAAATLVLLATVPLGGCGPSTDGPEAAGSDPAADVSPPLVPAPAPGEVSLVAVGDVMLDRGVADAIAGNGLDSILPIVAPQLGAADIAFANLECPIAASGPRDPERGIFRADPEVVAVLRQGSFDILSLANNHALNSGQAALVETIEHLEAAGIRYVGAARDPARGADPALLVVRERRIGVLAYGDVDVPAPCQSRIGGDFARLRAQIAAAKAGCELLIVSFHWGEQGSDQPTQRQIDLARASVDAGADLVLGHHPHVLQGAEIYARRLVLYSMGDFVFDARNLDEAASGIFRIHYDPGRGLRLLMVPVFITTPRRGPEYPPPALRDHILERFSQMSAARGTAVRMVDGIGVVECPF